MSTTFIEILSRVLELIDRQSKIISILDCSALNKAINVLKHVRKEVHYPAYVVVLGKYGCGKSTLTNALLGQKLLPTMHRSIYNMVTEIQYYDKPIVTLYPTKKSGKGPFDVQADDLNKYIVFNTEEWERHQKKEKTYEKVVLKYPIDICKAGVVFVDSPGLDDPACHDVITTDYLPKADTIIYCMNAQQPFSMKDKTVIESLNDMGYKSIIFVLTYFDAIEYSDEMAGTNNADDIKVIYTRLLKHYTDLGDDGIFFVGSLPALNGKLKKDESLLESSHLPKLETKLKQILKERSRLKLLRTIDSVGKVNRETCRFLMDKIDFSIQNQTSSSRNQISKLQVARYITLLKNCNIISEELVLMTNELIMNVCYKN